MTERTSHGPRVMRLGHVDGLTTSGGSPLSAREIDVTWNHDAANKKIAFVHVACEGERYTLQVEYQPGFGPRRWKIGRRSRWMVTDG